MLCRPKTSRAIEHLRPSPSNRTSRDTIVAAPLLARAAVMTASVCIGAKSICATSPASPAGPTPSHAHHVRYAQPRGLGLKLSDEFTVPLCATHHHNLHDTTKEREWWQDRKVDPLSIAQALWHESQRRSSGSAENANSPKMTSEPVLSEEHPKSTNPLAPQSDARHLLR